MVGIDWTSVAAGAASVGFPTLGFWVKAKQARESRAQALYDKIMAEVTKENRKLKEEVAELKEEVEHCKRRDARIMTIETCLRLLVPEIIALDPLNRTLAHVGMLLRAVPLESNTKEFDDLLLRIDEADRAARKTNGVNHV